MVYDALRLLWILCPGNQEKHRRDDGDCPYHDLQQEPSRITRVADPAIAPFVPHLTSDKSLNQAICAECRHANEEHENE